jgi:hypothetical protein
MPFGCLLTTIINQKIISEGFWQQSEKKHPINCIYSVKVTDQGTYGSEVEIPVRKTPPADDIRYNRNH